MNRIVSGTRPRRRAAESRPVHGRQRSREIDQTVQAHESLVEFRMEGGGSVAWWFVERDVQTEQRREQVVLELRRLFPHRCRHRLRRH